LESEHPDRIIAVDFNPGDREDHQGYELVVSFPDQQEIRGYSYDAARGELQRFDSVDLACAPTYLESGDLDGDGAAEIVVICESGEAQVLNTTDAPALGGPYWRDAVRHHETAAVADLDGDGDDELVTFGEEELGVYCGDPATVIYLDALASTGTEGVATLIAGWLGTGRDQMSLIESRRTLTTFNAR